MERTGQALAGLCATAAMTCTFSPAPMFTSCASSARGSMRRPAPNLSLSEKFRKFGSEFR
jgi:hypothetical protein